MENIISLIETIYTTRNIYQCLILYDDINMSNQYLQALSNLDYDCVFYSKEDFEQLNTIQYYDDIKQHRCFFIPICCLLRYSCMMWKEMSNFTITLSLSPEAYQYQKNLFNILKLSDKSILYPNRINLCAY